VEIERSEPPPLPWWAMAFLAVAVGVIAAGGAVAFHNLLFLGELSWNYDANLHTAPAPWGFLVILAPMIGAVGVAFIVGTFAPEAKGHGVPEVMEAIYYREGRIRPAVAIVKSIASALSINPRDLVGVITNREISASTRSTAPANSVAFPISTTAPRSRN